MRGFGPRDSFSNKRVTLAAVCRAQGKGLGEQRPPPLTPAEATWTQAGGGHARRAELPCSGCHRGAVRKDHDGPQAVGARAIILDFGPSPELGLREGGGRE